MINDRTVLLAQSGDREALNELLTAIQLPLYRFVNRLSGGNQLAEDVLQNTFLQVYRKLPLLKDPALFRTWTYRIASRECFRIKSDRRRDEFEEIDSIEELPVKETTQDLKLDLEKLFPQLSPGNRAVLSLHYFDGFSLDDIAVILDIPAGTVRSRLNYGLKKLKTGLEGR